MLRPRLHWQHKRNNTANSSHTIIIPAQQKPQNPKWYWVIMDLSIKKCLFNGQKKPNSGSYETLI